MCVANLKVAIWFVLLERPVMQDWTKFMEPPWSIGGLAEIYVMNDDGGWRINFSSSNDLILLKKLSKELVY